MIKQTIGFIVGIIIAVVLATLLLQYLWAWLIPVIFPVPTEMNYIVSELKFWEAFWLTIFISLIGFRNSSSN